MDKKERKTIFSVQREECEIVCYEDTYYKHINNSHPDVLADEIESTLTSPEAICFGTSNSDYHVYVGAIKSASGSPLCVIVNPVCAPQIVVTASYRRDFRALNDKNIIWMTNTDE